MSLCPVCGRGNCDHTAEERGQTREEMMRPLSKEEKKAWNENLSGAKILVDVAQKHAHDPVGPVGAKKH